METNASVQAKGSGLFSSFIQGGIKLDIAKSALQKGIRRGSYIDSDNNLVLNADLAVGMALRILKASFEVNSKAIRSNLFNRLIIIAGEDISVGSLECIRLVDISVDKLRNEITDVEEQLRLVGMLVGQMCYAPKIRLVSWWKSAYFDAINKGTTKQLSSQELGLFKELEKSELPIIDKWKDSFSKRSRISVYYAMKLHVSEEKKKIPRLNPISGKSRNIQSPIVYELWNEILKSEDRKYIDVMYKWYCNENENHIYLILVHAIILEYEKCNKSKSTFRTSYCEIIEKSIDKAFTENFYIPDYVIDSHTALGRANGMTAVNFVKEGSKVTNMWMNLYEKELEDLYGSLKDNNPNVLNEESLKIIMSSNTPRGQILTSSWKPYVYIPTEAPYNKYVYKGPFGATKKQTDATKTYIANSQAFKLLGTSVIEANELVDHLGRKWLQLSNVSSVESDNWKTTKILDEISKTEVLVVDKESLGYVQLSELDDDELYKQLFGKNKMYIAFMDAALLGRGDMGPWNALYVKETDKCYIIDYENESGRKEISEPQDIFARRSGRMMKICALGFEKQEIKAEVRNRIDKYKEVLKDLEAIVGINLENNYEMLKSLLNE